MLKIQNLRVLHIENCGLSQIPAEISRLTSSLKKLKFPRNKLSQIPETMSALGGLEQLDLSRNSIIRLPNTLFVSMDKIKEVNLSGNAITYIPTSIGACAALRVLDLSDNR